jgi:hypothetical protein
VTFKLSISRFSTELHFTTIAAASSNIGFGWQLLLSCDDGMKVFD